MARRPRRPPRPPRPQYRDRVGHGAGPAHRRLDDVFRKGPSWPPSVATVQSEIITACQNPDVVSEPGQVNFAAKGHQPILWVFALMSSGDNPDYADAETGRKGPEPITPAQGGEIAWSLNRPFPYNPLNPVDSLQVAARAIDNVIGGRRRPASTAARACSRGWKVIRRTAPGTPVPRRSSRTPGAPASAPARWAAGKARRRSSATLPEVDVGATSVAAQDVSVLFENFDNPGDLQVQAVLKTRPGAG